VLFRSPVAADADPVPFSSPWRTVTFDRVVDVSEHVKLAVGDGGYELSVPLDVLGLDPGPGMVTLGDVGLLRGQAGFTRQRVYWHNKATGYTTDVPGEAMLQPHLWGRWRFE